VRVLEHPAFLAGELHTGFLDDHDTTAPRTGDVRRAAAAAALALQAVNRDAATRWRALPSGWRNNPAVDQHVALRHGDQSLDVRYRLGRDPHLSVDGDAMPGELTSVSASQVVCHVDGVRVAHDVRVIAGPTGTTVHVDGDDGAVSFVVAPRFPEPDAAAATGSLTAPMPGAIVAVRVEVGEAVVAGQPLLSLEAMKMEHQVLAPVAGVVEAVLVGPGDQVDTGQPLLRLGTDEPGAENDGGS
jgi:propionyl-CoA carboxylase alpha chain